MSRKKYRRGTNSSQAASKRITRSKDSTTGADSHFRKAIHYLDSQIEELAGAGVPAAAFSAVDLCAILSAAQNTGTLSFSYQGLTFSRKIEEEKTPAVELREDPGFQEHLLRINEARIKQENLENLKITDPFAYEELIASGELTPPKDDESPETEDE